MTQYKYYSVADAVRFVGWNALDSKQYRRVWDACAMGFAGPGAKRMGRGWLLTQANLDRIKIHIEQKWHNEPGKVEI